MLKAADTMESDGEETVVLSPAKREGETEAINPKKRKLRKIAEMRMTSEELIQMRSKITKSLTDAIRGMNHTTKGKREKKCTIVFKIPSFGFGMQIVENFGTQTSSKSENAKVILSNPAEILAVFPELSSKFDKIPMEYDYRTGQHVELIDQVIIKKCQDVEIRHYPRDCELMLQGPHFYFCDATVSTHFPIIFKMLDCLQPHAVIRISMRDEDEYPMEFSSDIPGHFSMNPRFPGNCAVLPPS